MITQVDVGCCCTAVFELYPTMSEDSVDIEVTIAQRMLGLSYKNGTGVAKDTSVAATWFEKAAAHKDIPSLMSLGTLYQRGLGVDEDGERAFALYQQAANLGKKKRPDFSQNVTQHSQSKASSLDGYLTSRRVLLSS
jgi:TPR repeat protein